jgi:hypothetical protein
MNEKLMTDLAKGAVSMLIVIKVEEIVEGAVDTRTNLDTDRTVVKLGCWMAASTITGVTSNYTDKAVDATIAKFKSWKQNRKKTTTE